MKVWIVGISDCEDTMIYHVCLSKKTALVRWDERRLEIIEAIEDMIKRHENKSECKMYKRMLKNLAETDPEKMDNFPHEEPFIKEMETEP